MEFIFKNEFNKIRISLVWKEGGKGSWYQSFGLYSLFFM